MYILGKIMDEVRVLGINIAIHSVLLAMTVLAGESLPAKAAGDLTVSPAW